MFKVKIDSKEINRILNNTVSYSYGFLDGIDMEQIVFNQQLGELIADALSKYIDAQARANPSALHHVYEWNRVGNQGARLFDIKAVASKRVITFSGKFLPSKSVSDTSSQPFVDKANIMENAIGITIEPSADGVLAFEDDGEMYFSATSVYIAHPGGDAVAGSFGRVVDEFFLSYLTNALLKTLISDLSTADEYTKFFAAGTRSGAGPGIKAGKQYLNISGVGIE